MRSGFKYPRASTPLYVMYLALPKDAGERERPGEEAEDNDPDLSTTFTIPWYRTRKPPRTNSATARASATQMWISGSRVASAF